VKKCIGLSLWHLRSPSASQRRRAYVDVEAAEQSERNQDVRAQRIRGFSIRHNSCMCERSQTESCKSSTLYKQPKFRRRKRLNDDNQEKQPEVQAHSPVHDASKHDRSPDIERQLLGPDRYERRSVASPSRCPARHSLTLYGVRVSNMSVHGIVKLPHPVQNVFTPQHSCSAWFSSVQLRSSIRDPPLPALRNKLHVGKIAYVHMFGEDLVQRLHATSTSSTDCSYEVVRTAHKAAATLLAM
jgi:hypothetical protein